MQNCSNDNLDDYNVFLSSPLHYPDDCNNNQKDSCVGDSGSGLVAWNPDTKAFELIGVVSFGPAGCDSSIGGDVLDLFTFSLYLF